MAINVLNKLAAEISDVPIKEMDGSPMLDENNNPATATMFGPGSKIWQVANDAARRKLLRRAREANGKLEAATETSEDKVEFLCAIIKRFNGLELPNEADQVRAILSHPLCGYIRDQLAEAAGNWENFIKASPQAASSPPAISPG